MLIPRTKTPELSFNTLDHGSFDLATEAPEWGTLICFYRGFHCPACANYLIELQNSLEEFAKRGVGVVAVSIDAEERASKMAEKIAATNLRIGFDLSLSKAREWGLYLSTSRGKTSIGIEEPAIFPEPGLFLIRPDQTLFLSSVQTVPFARSHVSELLSGLDFIQANDYPPRGEYTGAV